MGSGLLCIVEVLITDGTHLLAEEEHNCAAVVPTLPLTLVNAPLLLMAYPLELY